ncbi:MAG TPA: uroporphyrinogen decarboxylase family protein, partial [Clostridia bacterium]|nr:uroporphyrinogen decarboxylase family protein [Clostridia bacterium]
MRRMDNALMDVAAEPEQVAGFLDRLMPLALSCVEAAAECGADGVIIADDWGMQFSPFISPASFRALFKPAYARIAQACHARDMDFMLHSCGFVLPLVDDMIDAGIDVFQFDQPEAAGCTLWAERYGQKAVFYSPVDIQKIMPTGDRALIEEGARHMAECFRASGSLIAKDYPSWQDIGVEAEWARWARETLVANSKR